MSLRKLLRTIFSAGAAISLLTSCDALGIKTTIPKCDDPKALELTANLIRLNSGMRDPVFGVPVNLVADHSLATTEMILNQGIDKEIGKTTCLASFVFTSRSKEPTTDTCKYVSRTGYELQNDTTGQLVSTIAELGPLSCVKFTQDEVTSLTFNPTDPSRQNDLGVKNLNGDGTPQNYVEALKWFQKSADQGDASAQHNLGLMYYNGDGVPKSDAEAVKWYRLAAEQGDAAAQSNLGVMYAKGEGVPKNPAEAVKWYRKAADQGNAQAQSNLGGKYAYGEGVPRDIVTAREWWNKTVTGDADDLLKSFALYALGESFYAGEEFGSIDDMAQAKIFWKRVIEVGMTTEQSHKLASAGLACIERGKSSKNCQPLRCSIEGRSDCPDL